MFSAKLSPDSELRLKTVIQQLADATDRPVEAVLKQQGRLLANDLAFRIHPLSFSPKVGKAFQKSIRKSVLRFYKDPGWLYSEILKNGHPPQSAAYVLRLVKTGQWSKAESLVNSTIRVRQARLVMVGAFDGGLLHKAHRWGRGTKRHPVLVLGDMADATAYADRQAELAGFAKAALVNAGRQLDGKIGGTRSSKKGVTNRPPKWIIKHANAPGRGSLKRRKKGFDGSITSGVRYAREALPPKEEAEALRVRSKAAEGQLERIIDANIRKAMRGA